MATLKQHIEILIRGQHDDPFSVLGPHSHKKNWALRTFQPRADAVTAIDENGKVLGQLKRIHPHGLFEARLPLPFIRYRLEIEEQGKKRVIEDTYRFDSPLGDMDRYLINEGTHLSLADKLGAHIIEIDGIRGVHFAVWAPNARRVSVVGPFNQWDGRCHPMRRHPGSGIWDIFIPDLGQGELYKFELMGAGGKLLPLKADPLARRMEPPPGNASVVHSDDYAWQDDDWMAERSRKTALDQPLSVYEVHLGSWRRHSGSNNWLTYRELADQMVPYIREMGFTHIELLPVSEHPFDGSWGYQPIGLFAPTWRFGSPADFKYLIDRCHQAGIGVIMDWVPAHFPRDAHGLGFFDGTHLYEHADPRKGAHQDWGTLIFNFGRNEVSNYLLASATFWVQEYHIDALRVDAVASMLYLDYSREDGQWVPNEFGGNENLEAVRFLRRMNEQVHAVGGVTMAEESTAWPMVSRPTYLGGLGFTYKWNMGWMHDSLAYMKENPIHRRFHHDKLTFALLYAFSENFILPLSHDEVVHGKGSILARMSGDAWQKFANLRLYYTYMYTHPGKKLLFMGCEFGQGREWNHNAGLDWHLLGVHWHSGVQQLMRDLNQLYAKTPALYEIDFTSDGFEWIDCTDNQQSVIAFIRKAKNPNDCVVTVCNFTPVPRQNYRIGVPHAGFYRELINSDSSLYSGSGVGNYGGMEADEVSSHGRPYSLNLTLPPLGALVFQPEKIPAQNLATIAEKALKEDPKKIEEEPLT